MKTLVASIVCISIFLSGSAFASGPDHTVLDQISKKINTATTPEDRAKYYVYQARWYKNAGKLEFAMHNYDEAIKIHDTAWIRMERGNHCLKMKQYDKAIEDARIAKKDNPHFAASADKIIIPVEGKRLAIHNLENPKTIILDSAVDHNRLSRFDLANLAGNGGVEYQGKTYVTYKMGGISPDYGRRHGQQQDYERPPVFTAPGFKGKAKAARIHSQRVQYERERRQAADALRIAKQGGSPDKGNVAESRGTVRRNSQQKRSHSQTATGSDRNDQNIPASNQHKYAGSDVKDLYGRKVGKVDSVGNVRDNFSRKTGSTVDNSGNERNLWKQKTGAKAK